MTAKSAIIKALEFGERFCGALADMSDAPLLRPCKNGNHAMWIAGHLAVTEGRMHKVLTGEPNPLEAWKPMFDWGSDPSDEASAYPPFADVLGELKKLRAKTLEYLNELSDSDLDQPVKHPLPNFPVFDTVGNTLVTLAIHQCGHAGEAWVVRRAAGKQPFFKPSEELKAS